MLDICLHINISVLSLECAVYFLLWFWELSAIISLPFSPCHRCALYFFVKHNLNSALLGDRRGAHRVLVGRLEVTRSPGKPRLRWEDNIRLVVQEVVWGGTDWITRTLAQNWDKGRPVANAVMYLRIPKNSWNVFTILESVSSSGKTLLHGVS
jgi:hypothetical protein